jgi:hypothetical protein
MKHNLNSFRRNELLQGGLAEVMRHPSMVAALEVLRELGEPAEMPVPGDVDFLIFNALQNARREGFFHALRSLEALATPIKAVPLTKDLMPSLVDE